jgi:hypothetical protein
LWSRSSGFNIRFIFAGHLIPQADFRFCHADCAFGNEKSSTHYHYLALERINLAETVTDIEKFPMIVKAAHAIKRSGAFFSE